MADDSKNVDSENRVVDARQSKNIETLDALVEKLLELQRSTITSDNPDQPNEIRWQKVEEFLCEYPQLLDQTSLVIDLIYNEFLLRNDIALAVGRRNIDPQEYLERFPEYLDELENQFQFFEGFQSGILTSMAAEDDSPLKELESVGDSSGEQRFKLLNRLGEGGFATVYKAIDNKLKRQVAIKIARTVIDPDSNQARRFTREAESAARLSHPSIVGVYEFGNEDGRPFIVEQLMEGGSLADRLNGKRVPKEDAIQWMIAICDALEYAHQFGIVHRDIKPGNILFDQNNRPHLADFGLASWAESDVTLTQQGDVLGTPAYMSPEQAKGGIEVGPLSDVYSLGVVLYELICGKLPFQGRSTSLLQQTIANEPPAPRSHDTKIPIDLQTVCLKAMAKSPSDRYGSAREMADDLRRFVGHEPIKARPIGPLGKFWRFCRRQPALAITSFVSLVVIVAISIVSFIRIAEQRDLYRTERDRANVQLYESLIANAADKIHNKPTGWYDSAFESLNEASQIDIPNKDVTLHRELMIEALVDTTPRFEVEALHVGNGSAVTSVAFDVDGKYVAAGYNDSSIRIYGFDLSNELRQLECPTSEPIQQLEFSSDGSILFALSGNELRAWELGNNQDILTARPIPLSVQSIVMDGVDSIAVTDRSEARPNKIAISSMDEGIRIFALASNRIGHLISTIDTGNVKVNDMDFSNDGEYLTAALDNSMTGRWTCQSGTLVNSRKTRDPIEQIATSGNVALSTDILSHACEFWRFDVGVNLTAQASSPYRHVGYAGSKAIAATRGGNLVLFDGGQRVAITTSSSSGEITSMSTSRMRNEILVGYRDGSIRKWEMRQSEIVTHVSALVGQVASDGQTIWGTSHKIGLDDQGSVNIQLVERSAIHSIQSSLKTGMLVWGHGKTLAIRDQVGNTNRIENAADSPIIKTCISPDENYIAAYSHSGTVRIWSIPDLKIVNSFDSSKVLAFGLTNTHLVIACPDGTFVRSIEFETESASEDSVKWLCQQSQVSAAIAINDDLVATCGNNNVIEIWDANSWELAYTLVGHTAAIKQIAFRRSVVPAVVPAASRPIALANDSVSNNWHIASLSKDNSLRFWDEQGAELRRVSVEPSAIEFAIDPRNDYIVLNFNDKFAHLYDFDSHQPYAVIADTTTPHPAVNEQLVFSGNGDRFYFAFESLIAFDRELLDESRRTGNRVGPYEIVEPGFSLFDIYAAAASRDGRWHVCGGHDRHVFVRDQSLGKTHHLLGGFGGDIWCTKFNPDSKWLAVGSRRDGNGELSLWNTSTWQCEKRIEFGGHLVSSISWHPTEALIAVGNFDGRVALIDVEQGEVTRELLPPGAATMHVEFNSTGQYLAAARTSAGFSVWSIDATKDEIKIGKPKNVKDAGQMLWGLTFTPGDKKIATVSESGKIKLYSFPDCQPIVTLDSGHPRLRKIAFSQDERLMVVSAYNPQAQIWRLDKLRTELEKHKLDW